MVKIKPEHAAGAVLLAGAAAFLWAGLMKAGGAKVPAVQSTTESNWNVPDPQQAILCMPDEQVGGQVVFSKHRYPDRVGGNVTTVIHFGHTAMSIPHEHDFQWLVNPPSEQTF